MSVQMNQSLSVDCAVFGFDGRLLKVLLVERRDYDPGTHLDRLKLPGAMILENETLKMWKGPWYCFSLPSSQLQEIML